MGNMSKKGFFQQAARAGWVLPLVAIGLMAVSSSTIRNAQSPITVFIMCGSFLLLLLAGLILGIVGCFGVKKYSARTTIFPGAIGAVLSAAIFGLLFLVAVSSFHEYRGVSTDKQIESLQKLAEQSNNKLPVMADSDTRVDKISVLGPDLIEYQYTFVNAVKDEFDEESYVNEARPLIMNNYWNSEDFALFRDKGISVRFSYYDKYGDLITFITAPADEQSSN